MENLIGKRVRLGIADEGEKSPGLLAGVVGLRFVLMKFCGAGNSAGDGVMGEFGGVIGSGVKEDQFVIPVSFGVIAGTGMKKSTRRLLDESESIENGDRLSRPIGFAQSRTGEMQGQTNPCKRRCFGPAIGRDGMGSDINADRF